MVTQAGWNALDELSRSGADVGGSGSPNLLPDSAAVVIGIGGSGIQTISRVRDALYSGRPEQAAVNSVQFVGIDAVDGSDQIPPLPEHMGLGKSSYVNIARDGFDANAFIRGQLPSDPFLQAWWDPKYQVPTGPIVQGLKKQRMLGRLAFHRALPIVIPMIESAITRALEIGGDLGEGASAPKPKVIPIYVVNSCVGGTGSSGFLSVIYSIWMAAMSKGYAPEIRAFTFLPSVFRSAINKEPDPVGTARDHDANAYAYFKELDYFLVHASELGGTYLGRSDPVGGTGISDNELLKQVYLIGSTMKGVGELTRIQDLYHIAAEAIFQFLVSNIGMPLVGANSTNTDEALRRQDATGESGEGKSRRYSSLGLARVVFPGDTYRRFATRRFVDWWITHGLLNRPDDLHSLARQHPVYLALREELEVFVQSVATLDRDEEVSDFLDNASGALLAMERTGDVPAARDLIGGIEREAPFIMRTLERSVDRKIEELLMSFDTAVTDKLFTTGHGVVVASEILGVLSKDARKTVNEAEEQARSDALGRVNSEDQVQELMAQLGQASNRALYQKALSKIGSITNSGRTQQEIADDLGRAIQSWAQGIHDAEISDGKARIASDLSRRIEELRLELDRTTDRLRILASSARAQWTDDDFTGKDAGADATTTVVPGDTLPEVEDSSLASSVFAGFQSEYGHLLSGVELNDLLLNWRLTAANRGLFALGAKLKNEQMEAELSFARWLLGLAEDRALFTGAGNQRRPRLPGSLSEAEQDPHDLTYALQGLATLSESVCWSWEPGRLFLEPGEPQPVVTTAIAAPADLVVQMKEMLGPRAGVIESPDPERVVALSVEWAIPVHALHDVTLWRSSYDSIQRRRIQDPSSHHPLHIDRRFDTGLPSLVPEYFERDEVVLQVTKALVFKQLLDDPETGLLDRYEHGRANPAVPVIRYTAQGTWQGREIRLVDGRLRAERADVALGSSWAELVAGIGENQGIRESIDTTTVFATEVASPKRIEAAVAVFLSEHLEEHLDECPPGSADRKILDEMFDKTTEWQDELRKMSRYG